MERKFTLIATILVTGVFTDPANAQNRKPTLIRVRTADGSVIVGELLREDKAELELLNLKTGEKQSVQKQGPEIPDQKSHGSTGRPRHRHRAAGCVENFQDAARKTDRNACQRSQIRPDLRPVRDGSRD